MEFDDDQPRPPAKHPPDRAFGPPWIRGAVTSAIGVLIGTIAFVVFCYSLGLNFNDEGWSDDGNAWQTHRPALVGSLLGFAVAILVFWLGFVQMTRTKS